MSKPASIVCRSCRNTGADIAGKPCVCLLSPEWCEEVARLRTRIAVLEDLQAAGIGAAMRAARNAAVTMRNRAMHVARQQRAEEVADAISALGAE